MRFLPRHSLFLRVLGLLAAAALVWSAAPTAAQQEAPPELAFPRSAALAGTFQTQVGCPGNWNTDCEATALSYDPVDNLWKASLNLAAGRYEYKVALNGTWDDNFGRFAEYYGENIPLVLEADRRVTFTYNLETGWVTDDVNSLVANVPGDFQPFVGCPGEWLPDCLRSRLEDPDEDGIYTYITTFIPAGDYEAKVALDESWEVNYGADGAAGGANIPFTVPDGAQVTFAWDAATGLLQIATDPAPAGAPTEPPVYVTAPVRVNPDYVTIPGTIQSTLGCPADWQPECPVTFLTLDPVADVWLGVFDLPAGDYEYKVAINQTWGENYGLNALRDGPNIPLSVPAGGASVLFLYDHKSHWVTDSVNSRILSVAGSFQEELGCAADNDATCLTPWLVDPEGDGVYAGTILAGAVLPASGEAYTATVVEDGAPLGDPVAFTVPAEATEVYFEFDAEANVLTINAAGPPKGNLGEARAHWVSRDTLAWPQAPDTAATTFTLHYAVDGGLSLDPRGEFGGETIALSVDPAGLPAEIQARFPHLRDATALKIGADDLRRVRIALKGQLAVSAQDAGGGIVDATSLQIPGVLDDVYVYNGPLGVTIEDGIPTLRVWAPTARGVRLVRFADGDPNTPGQAQAMRPDPDAGIWSLAGEPDWLGQYYLYEVQVYVPSTGQVQTNLVTDPYSVSLATNSTRSQIVDLDDPAWMPAGWDQLQKPALARPEDTVIYELHVRDFSVNDPTVPAELKGTFAAFTLPDSLGMTHLKALAAAGLTHLHLLPVFDIATIDEDKSSWQSLSFEALAALPPDAEEQQALATAIRLEDGFNWGYDPLHYNVPEGSYSTNPEGAQRILEFREMVQALNGAGLRVVMDVVYNHTNAAGQSDRSVLDRIVPGYYHRLTERGTVANSTCCANTATEHNMMRKLMVDSVRLWATAYRVDGFRFDLMGHHMKDDMLAVRDTLRALTPEADGVDGGAIVIYGEGWDFGEVAANARGVNATQLNMAGTGIGTFNDRVRDAARGGSPFGGYVEQGFVTGLVVDPNEVDPRRDAALVTALRNATDQIRVALAGNLANFAFIGQTGQTVLGAQIDYNGNPAGYTADPQEQVVYISAHDNETWFDAVQYKVPQATTTADRARVQNLGLSLVALSQGMPFFHAGSDMLRSKSFDRDSFDSGDWFNRLDFSYQDNGWGSGLPPADKNRENWPLMQPLLADPVLQPTPADILANVNHLQEVLRVRRSSLLFRLETAEDVLARLRFHNTGPEQTPGLIVMSLSDVGSDLDPEFDLVVALFNAAPQPVTVAVEGLGEAVPLTLHPILAASADPIVRQATFAGGAFAVPGRTAAVFVVPKGVVSAETLPAFAVVAPVVQPEPTAEPAVEPEAPAAPPPATAPAPTTASPTAVPIPDVTDSAAGSLLPWAVGGVAVVAVAAAVVALLRRRRGSG